MKIGVGRLVIDDEMQAAALAALRNGGTTEKEETARFEEEFASYTHKDYCIATSSGTGALFCALEAVSNGEPRTVLTSPLTYQATVNVPQVLGWRVLFADIETRTFGLNPEEVGDTGTIMPVHLLGYPSIIDTDSIVVEDACEAVGAEGIGYGDIQCYSFYPSHTLAVGEMGAVTTDDLDLAQACRLIKDNGRDRRAKNAFRHELRGLNLKTSDVMASMARVQLRRIDRIIGKRRDNARRLYEKIKEIPNLTPGPYDPRGAYLGFPVLARSNVDRDLTVARLDEAGIETRKMFPVVYSQPSYPPVRERYPVAEKVSACGFYLPCHDLLTGEELDEMVRCLQLI